MKKGLISSIVAVAALATMPHIHAYTYSFSNHTNKAIAIGMKYQGINEPLEQRIIPPHERRIFRPGSGNIEERKAGFIVDKFYYIQDPILSSWLNRYSGRFTTYNVNNAPWRGLALKWIPSDKYGVAIELAQAVGEFMENVARAGIKAGTAYATAGASEVVEATAKQIGSATVLNTLAEGNYSLGKFFAAIGKSASYSMAKSRHIDIVEDENGNIVFLTLLSK